VRVAACNPQWQVPVCDEIYASFQISKGTPPRPVCCHPSLPVPPHVDSSPFCQDQVYLQMATERVLVLETGPSSWSRRLPPKTISPLLLVLGRCGWPGLNAPSPFPPPCVRRGLDWTAHRAREGPWPSCATFPDAPKIQRPPEAGSTLAAGLILIKGRMRSWRSGVPV
jgi:hypothetical protein